MLQVSLVSAACTNAQHAVSSDANDAGSWLHNGLSGDSCSAGQLGGLPLVLRLGRRTGHRPGSSCRYLQNADGVVVLEILSGLQDLPSGNQLESQRTVGAQDQVQPRPRDERDVAICLRHSARLQCLIAAIDSPAL